MTIGKLILSALLALAFSLPALAHEERAFLDCKADSEVVRLSLVTNGLDLHGRLVDNYIWGSLTCAQPDEGRIVCAGLWNLWSRNPEIIRPLLQRGADGRWTAELRRPTFYGGKKITLSCEAGQR